MSTDAKLLISALCKRDPDEIRLRAADPAARSVLLSEWSRHGGPHDTGPFFLLQSDDRLPPSPPAVEAFLSAFPDTAPFDEPAIIKAAERGETSFFERWDGWRSWGLDKVFLLCSAAAKYTEQVRQDAFLREPPLGFSEGKTSLLRLFSDCDGRLPLEADLLLLWASVRDCVELSARLPEPRPVVLAKALAHRARRPDDRALLTRLFRERGWRLDSAAVLCAASMGHNAGDPRVVIDALFSPLRPGTLCHIPEDSSYGYPPLACLSFNPSVSPSELSSVFTSAVRDSGAEIAAASFCSHCTLENARTLREQCSFDDSVSLSMGKALISRALTRYGGGPMPADFIREAFAWAGTALLSDAAPARVSLSSAAQEGLAIHEARLLSSCAPSPSKPSRKQKI